mgnify:CR=1 FL=1
MILYPGKQIRRRELVWPLLAVGLAIALAMRPQAASDPQAAAHLTPAQRAHIAERAAMHLAGTVAGCLSGGNIVWIDPHTGAEMGTFCETHVLSKGGRK